MTREGALRCKKKEGKITARKGDKNVQDEERKGGGRKKTRWVSETE